MKLDKLVEAAKAENWDLVDEQLPDVVKDYASVEWAYDSALSDNDGNVRDLGVSIIELADIPPANFKKMEYSLRQHMKQDDNPYVRFRCAFALAAHDSPDEEVVRVLNEATRDDDVADIAQNYLKKIE